MWAQERTLRTAFLAGAVTDALAVVPSDARAPPGSGRTRHAARLHEPLKPLGLAFGGRPAAARR